MGSNTKEPLLMIITTAGKDLTYPCYVTEYTYCKKILDPNVDVHNDEYLVDICELDKEDYVSLDNLDNERLWWKANPIRMSYKKGREKIRGDYEVAREQPEKMPDFLTKEMNIWVQARESGYMDMDRWKACEVKNLPINTDGRPVFVGFDMSARMKNLAHLAVMLWIINSVNSVESKQTIFFIVCMIIPSQVAECTKVGERRRDYVVNEYA